MVIVGMELLRDRFYICWGLEESTEQYSKVDASDRIPIDNILYIAIVPHSVLYLGGGVHFNHFSTCGEFNFNSSNDS